MALAAVGLVACSASDPRPAIPTTTAATTAPAPSTPSPTATLTSDQDAAVQSYRHYFAAVSAAEREPRRSTRSQLARYAIDPVLSSTAGSIAQLQVYGYAYRGTAPIPRVGPPSAVSLVSNHAIITFTDCPLVDLSWRAYSDETGRPAAPASAKALPPYLATIQVTRVGETWKVSRADADTSRTCAR